MRSKSEAYKLVETIKTGYSVNIVLNRFLITVIKIFINVKFV